jgi:hypothetical protein
LADKVLWALARGKQPGCWASPFFAPATESPYTAKHQNIPALRLGIIYGKDDFMIRIRPQSRLLRGQNLAFVPVLYRNSAQNAFFKAVCP